MENNKEGMQPAAGQESAGFPTFNEEKRRVQSSLGEKANNEMKQTELDTAQPLSKEEQEKAEKAKWCVGYISEVVQK